MKHQLDKRPETIATLFDGIAPVYDKINALLSFNLHKRWNRKLASALPEKGHLLDLCAGTGAISKELLKRKTLEKVTLLDVSAGMLNLARSSLRDHRADFIQGDALDLPFNPHHFDGVAVAYGIRNLPSLEKAFTEVRRVLKPGGTFAILELTRPRGFLAPFHALYLKAWVPLLGKLASGKGEAYHYLSNSVETFIPVERISEQLEETGFKLHKKISLLRGCATLFLSSS